MNGLKAVYCKEMKKIFKEPKMIFSVFILPVLLMIGIYVPAEGEFARIREFLAHIFGEQAELGYDYLQLLYLGRSNGCRSCCWYRRSAIPERRPF